MKLACPHCQHRLSLNDPKPGRYQPKCPKCGERFVLTVPTAPDQEPRIETLPPPAANTAEQTLAQPETSGPSPASPASAAATQHDATIAHGTAAATAADTSGRTAADAPRRLPPTIGGYRIVRELGHGAMGDVYLARQLSLERDVALKTIRPKWANNPAFIARFTREAYAAAQLTHHNIVQIYDLGVDGEFHYFSMEFVRGEALDRIVKREGPLPPRVAAGYTLQAARGLLFAHQFGMVHRDIKPANLILNDQGLIKVADMGLVKVPAAGNERIPAVDTAGGAEGTAVIAAANRSAMLQSSLSATLTHFAVGTPAFMPPEQAEDASSVDHRADIYSLGCTLFALLAGRSPFEGGSVVEILDKHRTQPIVMPAQIREKTPRELLAVVEKMTAKRPADRYADLQQVIDELERFLNGPNADAKSLRPEDLDELERGFKSFNSAPLTVTRRLGAGAAVTGGLALALVALPFSLRWSCGALCWLAASVSLYVLIAGVRDHTYLFGKVRQWWSTLRWADWASLAVGTGLFTLLLLLGLGIVGTIAVALLSVGAAIAFHELVDRRLARQRTPAVEQLERLVKHRRLAGVEETTLRQFIATNAGADWEEGFEQLFGYEALLAAREQLAQDARGHGRRRFRPWRDPVMRWLEARVQAARDARQRQVLARVEAQQLVSAGMTPAVARQQASLMAEGLVQQAAALRAPAPQEVSKAVGPAEAAEAKRQRIKQMLAAARSGAPAKSDQKKSSALDLLRLPLTILGGGRLRFLAGCLLLGGCLGWVHQNGLLSRSGLDQARTAAQAAKSGRLLAVLEFAFPTEPRALPLPIVGGWFTNIAPGIAGLTLILFSMGRSWKSALGSVLGAAIMMLGPRLGVPGVAALGGAEATSLVLGLTVAFGAVLIPGGRRR